FFFFFFQAEDGIRDLIVTGVQTCALPISLVSVLVPRGWKVRTLPRRSITSANLLTDASQALHTHSLAPVRKPLAFVGAKRKLTRDRKSTRLNSSHDQISYAVFCLKKKKLI